MFGNPRHCPFVQGKRAFDFIQNYKAANAKLMVQGCAHNSLWRPPTSSLWKINFDTAHMDEAEHGYGLVVRDAASAAVAMRVS